MISDMNLKCFDEVIKTLISEYNMVAVENLIKHSIRNLREKDFEPTHLLDINYTMAYTLASFYVLLKKLCNHDPYEKEPDYYGIDLTVDKTMKHLLEMIYKHPTTEEEIIKRKEDMKKHKHDVLLNVFQDFSKK